jgi:hypothetical protein
MKSLLLAALLASVNIATTQAQTPPNPAAAGQGTAATQQTTSLKQSMAANQQKLAKYQWVQSTEVSIKGKVRKDQQVMCRYGADGKVIKTPMGSNDAPQAPQGGLKGRIVAKKQAEMKDEAADLKELIGHYTPPNPAMLKATKEAGNSSSASSGGIVTLSFANYYKQGDKVSIGFDPNAKKLVSYDVETYLSNPKSDIVTLTSTFASLPDGTNYLQKSVLDAKAKEMQITTTNSNYSPVGQ